MPDDLYRILVSPVLEKIPNQLIVIPDGNLSYLPFELLLTQKAGESSYADLHYLLRQIFRAIRILGGHDASAGDSCRNRSRLFAGYAPEYENEGLTTARGEDLGCRAVEPFRLCRARQQPGGSIADMRGMVGGQAMLGAKATEAHFQAARATSPASCTSPCMAFSTTATRCTPVWCSAG
jgi:hypothetical protein